MTFGGYDDEDDDWYERCFDDEYPRLVELRFEDTDIDEEMAQAIIERIFYPGELN